jgi:hypothetical protein
LLIGFDAGFINVSLYKIPHYTVMIPPEVCACYGRAVYGSFGLRVAYAGSQQGKMIPLRPCRASSRLSSPHLPDHTMKNSVNEFIKAGKASLLTGDWI